MINIRTLIARRRDSVGREGLSAVPNRSGDLKRSVADDKQEGYQAMIYGAGRAAMIGLSP